MQGHKVKNIKYMLGLINSGIGNLLRIAKNHKGLNKQISRLRWKLDFKVSVHGKLLSFSKRKINKIILNRNNKRNNKRNNNRKKNK